MVVFPKQIERHLKQELPFMGTEKILMAAVNKGLSRQDMHEVIKVHSIAAGRVVKEEGMDNDLLERLAQDDKLPFSRQELEEMLGNYQEFTGRAKEQTAEFLQEVVKPCLDKYRDLLGNYDTSLSV